MPITLIKRRGLIPQVEDPTGKCNKIRQIQHQIISLADFQLANKHFDVFRWMGQRKFFIILLVAEHWLRQYRGYFRSKYIPNDIL